MLFLTRLTCSQILLAVIFHLKIARSIINLMNEARNFDPFKFDKVRYFAQKIDATSFYEPFPKKLESRRNFRTNPFSALLSEPSEMKLCASK